MRNLHRLFIPLIVVVVVGCDQRTLHTPAAPNMPIVSNTLAGESGRPSTPTAFPQEMSQYKSAFLSSSLSYIAVSAARSQTTLRESKFLGVPYWPKAMAYPKDRDGQPLQLLAQLNFDDMPKLESYPDKGILQFFVSPIESNVHVWGMLLYDGKPYDPQANFASMLRQDYFRVIYHETVSDDETQLRKEVPVPANGLLPVSSEARLSFQTQTGYVLNDDYRFAKIFGEPASRFFERFGSKAPEIGNSYFQHVYRHSLARVGGYGIFIQSDPRELRPDDDWIILLEIESSIQGDDVEIMWGDAGVGAFFIRRKDLANRDFSKVLYYWDNH